MKNIIVMTICLFALGGCKKQFLEIKDDIKQLKDIRPNPSFITNPSGQCTNDANHKVSEISQFKTVIYHEDFSTNTNSDHHQKDPTCYTRKPKCLIRGDWFMGGDCPFDETLPRYAGLKQLDKCTWKVWHDGSSMVNVVNMADGVEVSNGTLKLKMIPNPDYNPSKGQCGTIDSTQPGNYNMNCKMIAGGVDSNYLDYSHQGYNALYGRIEMVARFTTTTAKSSYPALWMWPERIGTGYPLTAAAAETHMHDGNPPWPEPNHIGEIDILETNGREDQNYAFQSYHQWDAGNVNAYLSQGRVVAQSGWHTYGVDWTPQDLSFYIDGCYTYQIKRGETSDHGVPHVPISLSDTASFMMMDLGTDGSAIDPSNRDIFEIKEVTVYH